MKKFTQYVLLLIWLLPTIAISQTITTPNLGLSLPPTGQLNWGPTVNLNFLVIDTAVGVLQNAYQGEWSSTKTYSKAQIVTFNGSSYMSLTNINTNNRPASSPIQWGLLAVSGGGATFPSTSNIVVNTSTTASRNATFNDVVGLFTGTGPCFLKNDGTCAAGTGSTSPGGSTQQIQFNSSGNFAGSAATLDVSGDLVALSYGGTSDAFLNQTTPTSNDGIANILSTPAAVATANNDYHLGAFNDWEASVFRIGGGTGGSFRNTFTQGLFPSHQGIPPPWANTTTLFDWRSQTAGTVFYQPGSQIPMWDDKDITSHIANSTGAGGTWFPRLHESEVWQSGKNGIAGTVDSRGAEYYNRINLSAGIDSLINLQAEEAHDGDNHLLQIIGTFEGSNTDAAGEANTLMRLEADQSTNAWTTTATATTAAGATVIATGNPTGRQFPADETPIIDSTQATSSFQIVGLVEPSSDAGSWTVSGISFTPDNICRISTNLLNVPETYNGVTTPETVSLGSCTISSTLSTSTTACVADQLHTESVVVDSSSAGSAVIELRLNHNSNAYIAQGPNACHMVEAVANEVANQSGIPLRDLTRIIGASNSTTLLYSSNGNGRWFSEPNGVFSNISFPPATLTRDGSGIVTMALGTPEFNGRFNGMKLHITSAVDNTYNGDFIVSEAAGISTTLSWNNAGTAGSTTTTAATNVLVGGVISNLAVMYPAATIVYPGNPATSTVDGTVQIEHSSMQINSGDQIEDQPSNYMPMNISHEAMNTFMPLGGGSGGDAHIFGWGGNLPDGATVFSIELGGDSAPYLFAGGTKTPSAELFDVSTTGTPFHFLFHIPAPDPIGSIINVYTCGLVPCSSVTNQYGIISLLGESTSFNSQWATAAGNYTETLTNNGAGITLREGKTASDWNLQSVNNAGTSPHVNVDFNATSILLQLTDNTSTSSFTQTSTGFSFDKPISSTSTINSSGYKVGGVAGFSGTCGPSQTVTIVNGIITGCV